MPDRWSATDDETVVPLQSAEAHVNGALEAPTVAEPMLDPVTSLPTLSYLVEQIQALQAASRAKDGPRRSKLAERVLIVVSIAAGEDRHAGLFLRARTASLLRALFTGDETIALLRQGLFGILARDRVELAADRAFLVSMLEEFEVEARVWIERVPADGPATANLLSSLLLAGDWIAGGL